MRLFRESFAPVATLAVSLLASAGASASDLCDGLNSPRLSPATVCGLTEALSADVYGGRLVGTPENAAVRTQLIQELQARGVTGAGESGFLQSFTITEEDRSVQVNNIIGVFDPNEVGGPPTVLLSAHFDGIVECERDFEADVSEVCNAAADNMTGVAAILGILDVIGPQLASPVAIAFWDGEEAVDFHNELGGAQLDRGLLGSVHFAGAPTFDPSALRLHLNFESLGFDVFEGMENQVFAIGTESGGAALRDDVAELLSAQTYPLRERYVEFAMAQKRCDLEGFVRRGWTVPYVMLSDGPSGLYHSKADDAAHVNWPKVMAVAEAALDLTLQVAAQDPGYVYAGDIPLLVWLYDVLYRPSYSQLFVLRDITNEALANVNAAAYPSTKQRLDAAKSQLSSWINAGSWLWGINFISAISWLPVEYFPIFTDHAQERLTE